MEHGSRVLALSLGGAVGVNARYWIGLAVQRWLGPQFPWATFLINVSGAFAIGFLSALLARWAPHGHLRLVVLVGILGGYTTFSTFAFETVTLWQRGQWRLSLVNGLGSVAAGCLAVVLGAALAQGLARPPLNWGRASPPSRSAPVIANEKAQTHTGQSP